MKIDTKDTTVRHCLWNLLAYRLNYTFEAKTMLKIESATLDAMFTELDQMYEVLHITRDDVKQAWKQALKILIYDCTLISGDLPAAVHVDGMRMLERKLIALINKVK